MAELEQRTGVNRETIRVYVRRGLVPQPERPKSTVAHYTEHHVRAIGAIRELQQQYRMSLAQIANVLAGNPIGQRVEATAFPHLEQLVASGVGVQDKYVAVSELEQRYPHAPSDARALERLGMIDIVHAGAGPLLSQTDARLLSIWGEMREAGFDEAANFHPDSLDHYMRAAQYLAGAEAEKFLARTEGRLSEETAASMLATALPLMLDFFGLLRNKLFIRNIGSSVSGRKYDSVGSLDRSITSSVF